MAGEPQRQTCAVCSGTLYGGAVHQSHGSCAGCGKVLTPGTVWCEPCFDKQPKWLRSGPERLAANISANLRKAGLRAMWSHTTMVRGYHNTFGDFKAESMYDYPSSGGRGRVVGASVRIWNSRDPSVPGKIKDGLDQMGLKYTESRGGPNNELLVGYTVWAKDNWPASYFA